MPEIINGYPVKFGLTFQDKQYFTEENDHNPLVIPKCPHCIMGKIAGEYFGHNITQGHIRCEHCNGTGYAHPPLPERMFTEETNAIEVSCNKAGHLHCPKCGWGFKYYDKRIFSGKRHTCGQKLIIDTSAHDRLKNC